MSTFNVVLLQTDRGTTESLAAPLRQMFGSVREAQSLGDLRTSLAGRHTDLVILDLESASVSELERLLRDFPEVRIVCNHRLADDEMWTASLSAGAADCCPSNDIRGILRAALQNRARTSLAA